MKKIGLVLLGALLILMTSCATYAIRDISIVEDDFTGNKIVTREVLIGAEENDSFTHWGSFKFVNTINASETKFDMYFTLNSSLNSTGLDDVAFLKFDDELMEISLSERTDEEISESGVTKVYDGQTGEMVDQPYHHNYKKLSGRITVAEDIIRKIEKCTKLTVRFYSASEPVTFLFTEETLEAIHSVINPAL